MELVMALVLVQVTIYPAHAFSRTAVSTSETRMDPITPKRLEKKMNITLPVRSVRCRERDAGL
jgi:hypothetical protein